MSSVKTVVAIEGLIGAGKSTMMNILRKKLNEKAQFIDEPVDEWIAMRDENDKNLLETFYSDMKRWSYTFQNIAYITRMNRLADALNGDASLILMDRSLTGDKNTFTKMLQEDKRISKIEMEAYNKWCDFFQKYFGSNMKMKYVYLRCDPEVAFMRIQLRGRGEESAIPLDYLKRLHKAHEEWLLNDENVLVLDVNDDFVNDEEKIRQVLDFF
jgi:deoxyadenosine/deoxycytidine kinase